jgi:hypothetical protein
VTDPETTTNVAKDHANVDVQAGVVHGDINHFTVPPDASPEEKFEKGINLLHSGVPSRALKLIDAAVDEDYHTDKVFFYWLLALVSGRTWNELSDEETTMLRNRNNIFLLAGDDVWADGVRTIDRLLDSTRNPETDLPVLLKELDKLEDLQRELIVTHLQLFLDGPIQDQMWARAMARDKERQAAGNRASRAWKFFQPKPADPRVRRPDPALTPITLWIQAVAGTVVFIAAAIFIGYLLAQSGRILTLLAYLLIVSVGYAGARDAVEWRFRVVRRFAKDGGFGPRRRHGTASPPGGFARRVDRSFARYFVKYVPDSKERGELLAETVGIRRSMRDELVEIYREKRISAEEIAWLIRYQVRQVRDRWRDGTLWSYRDELATPLRTRATAALGLTVSAGVGIWAVGTAMSASPSNAAPSGALMLAAGWIAARAWLQVILERRRVAADTVESAQVLAERKAEFDRWQARLADRPEDAEMAAWLDCDRKVLLNEVLQHYRLTMSTVIAYAFVEAGASPTRRARARGGPWRYSKYRLLVFLLTNDGVRQLTVRLDFYQGTIHDRRRTNYRYEAVAAVQVRQADHDERTFELALVNGDKIKVQVIGPGMEQLQEGETAEQVSDVTLDAAGLHHTLHVLEGIAAEGREWFERERQRGETRAKNLAAAVRNPQG